MAFRLKHGSISKELRRLVHNELNDGIDVLGRADVTDADIHEARKHIKKVRSILKLLRAALGSKYAAENNRLRSIGHGLGRVRDPEAMIETLEAIRGRYSEVISAATKQRVARGLRGPHRAAHNIAPNVARHAAGILKRACKSLPDQVAGAGSLRSVQQGLASVYKRSRSALADLTRESDALAFHAWRRRVKEHWYHVRLFDAKHPAARARARSLKALEKELGDDHNLAILSAALLENPGRFGNARTTGLVLGCIQKRQRALRKRALARGRRLFAAKPKKVEATVGEWWRGKR